jgi:hypothetical protein
MIPSVRNATSQHLSVFDSAVCSIVYYTPEMESRIEELKEARPNLKAYKVSSLDAHINATGPHFMYNRTWVEGRTDPILVAHSSGSTG